VFPQTVLHSTFFVVLLMSYLVSWSISYGNTELGLNVLLNCKTQQGIFNYLKQTKVMAIFNQVFNEYQKTFPWQADNL
jgi:hypothetical protein